MAEKKYGPMTHEDLGKALDFAVAYSFLDSAKSLIVRLVAEIYRLRQRARLQRRRIVELERRPAAHMISATFEASHADAEDGDALVLRPLNDAAKDLVADVEASGPERVSATIGASPMARITSAEDFVRALGDAIEADKLPGVLGIDDEGIQNDGGHALTLLLNDDAQSRIPITVGPAVAGEEVSHG